MKKTLSILLSLVLVIAALPLAAVESTALTDGDWEYSYVNDEATVTGYTGTDTDIVIPSTLGGYSVTKIGNSAFSGKTTLTSVTIPEGVTSIGDYAFQNCKLLTDISFPLSLRTIGRMSFKNCDALESLVFNNGLQELGSYSFESCDILKSVTIPASLNKSSIAFNSCSKLDSVYISDLEAWMNIDFSGYPLSYSYDLYLNNQLVTNLVTPNTVTVIKSGKFWGCKSITNVTVSNGTTCIESSAFNKCVNLITVTLPSSITAIKESAFRYSEAMTGVYITDVGAWCNIAFDNEYANPLRFAHKLYVNNVYDTVTVPNTVSVIKKDAFAGIENDVVLPDSVTTIEQDAFYNSKCESITLGNGLTSIGSNAFYGNTALKSITIPGTLTSMGNSAFYGCTALETLVFCEGVKSVSQYAFQNCSKLKNITFPSTMKTLGYMSFKNCTALETLVLNEGLEYLDGYAFEGCSNLKSVTIPSTLTKESAAFHSCNKLDTVYISDLEAWCNIEFYNYGYILGGLYDLYLNGSLVTDLVIPDTVTSIPAHSFGGCKSIESVNVPEGVTSIGSAAFYNCINLKTVTLPASITAIKESAFRYSEALTGVYITDVGAWCNIAFDNEYANPLRFAHKLYVNNVYDTVTVPNTVSVIKKDAFAGIENDVVLPDSVTTIEPYAFYNSKCESVTLGNGLTSMGNNAFQGNTALKSITIPGTLTSMGNSAFYGCTVLETVVFCEGVESVSQYAFQNCSKLKNITLPSTMKTLGYMSFKNCDSLEYLRFNSGLETIGAYAFESCDILKTVIVPSSVTSMSYCLNGCSNITDYYCFIGTAADTYWTKANTKHYFGDFNTDNDVNLTDYAQIKTYLAGENVDPLTDVQEIVGDYNLDGAIDAFDMFEIDKYHNGLI